MPASAAALAGVVASLVLAATAPAPTELFRLQDPALEESSGLAVSARHDGIVWTHPDGGEAAEVMAVDDRGRTVATIRLRGVDPYDPEALAPGRDDAGRPALFLGDIGDNRARRPDISVFRFPEPTRLSDQTVDADWFQFSYPDGPRDAEALLVDPRDGRIWVATKDVFGGGLYRAPARPRTDRTNPLERVGDVPGLITDGAFLPDGGFVLRSYTTAFRYDDVSRPSGQLVLPEQEQGESLAVDGDRLLVGSEGTRSTVHAVPLPSADPLATSAPSGEPTGSAEGETSGSPASAQPDSGVSWPVVALSLLAGAFAAAAGASALRSRRHHR